MTKHFASSWLQSLSNKLESLPQWSWQADRRGDCMTHRNLFREFFSAQFGKTLALVDEAKKTDFVAAIERNIFKFDGDTQQYPLTCLCALLDHGREAAQTQEKISAWVHHVLERLRCPGVALPLVVEECLSAPFKRFVALIDGPLQNRLADGLGERLVELEVDMQGKAMDELEVLLARVNKVMVDSTEELNVWLDSAPRFPGTPLALADILARLEHPLVRFFARVKELARKEAFLVSVALALRGLRTQYRWMCAAEPDLDSLGEELQRKLFIVDGRGLMDMWLSSRLKKYNAEVVSHTSALVSGHIGNSESLRLKLEAAFPVVDAATNGEATDDVGWLDLDRPSVIADALLAWLAEHRPDFFCPRHTVARETLCGILLRYTSTFEVDAGRTWARRRVACVAPATALALQATAAGSQPASTAGATQVAAPAGALVFQMGGSAQTPAGDVSNLVDLLLNEALEGVAPEVRTQIHKLSDGVYRMGSKEVTLHTTSGRLYVYRIGDVVRHLPIQTLLQEEGLLSAQPAGAGVASPTGAAPAGAQSGGNPLSTAGGGAPLMAPPTSAPPSAVSRPILPLSGVGTGPTAIAATTVDTSAVVRIAQQSRQISIGLASGAPAAAPVASPAPFTSGRPPPQEGQSLMNKRVEAATRAMDIAKQVARRAVNFDDEKLLRKLLCKGIKADKKWAEGYQEFCTSKGVAETDPKGLNKEHVVGFLERNLGNFTHEDWAKKLLHPSAKPEGEKKDKKDKKAKKEKKKDKKRKASDSSSSADAQAADTAATGSAGSLALATLDSSPGAGAQGGMLPGMPDPWAAAGMCPPGMPGVDHLSGMHAAAAMFGMAPFGMPMGVNPSAAAGMMAGMPPLFGEAQMMAMGIPDERAWKRSRRDGAKKSSRRRE